MPLGIMLGEQYTNGHRSVYLCDELTGPVEWCLAQILVFQLLKLNKDRICTNTASEGHNCQQMKDKNAHLSEKLEDLNAIYS